MFVFGEPRNNQVERYLNGVACDQQVNDAKIETLEELLNEIEASLAELRENQISVAHHETRQLVMIKI